MKFDNKMTHSENCSKGYGITMEYKEVLREAKSEFQNLKLVQSVEHGLVLIIDGNIQLVQDKEFQYHEPLTYYPILASTTAKKVLVIGGGDLGVLNYLIGFSEIEHIDFVELDELVIEFSKEFLKSMYGGALFDGRIHPHISDGRIFVSQKTKEYDVIIMDMTDPAGPSKFLYTKEFFFLVKNALKDDGVFSMHTLSPDLRPAMFGAICNTLASEFSHVNHAFNYTFMYGGLWSYAICCNFDISKLPPSSIEKKLRQNKIQPKLLDAEGFFAYLHTPNYIKEILDNNKGMILDNSPLNIRE